MHEVNTNVQPLSQIFPKLKGKNIYTCLYDVIMIKMSKIYLLIVGIALSFWGSVSSEPDQPQLLWTHKAACGITSPAVVGGKVYVGIPEGVNPILMCPSVDDHFFCLDAQTGDVLWK